MSFYDPDHPRPDIQPSAVPPRESEPHRRGLPLPLHPLFWTYVLLGLIIVVFVIEQTLPFFVGFILPYLPSEYTGVTPQDFAGGSTNSLVLILMGANFHPLVEKGQVWRFFTSMFLHIGFVHLFFNAYALLIFGRQMERIYGPGRFIIIYILAGLFGSLISFVFSQADLSAGASGAIFGLIGMQLVYFYKHKDLLGEIGRSGLTNTLFIIGINIFLGFSSRGIDNFAHMGGLIFGALLGYTMSPVYKLVDQYTSSPRLVDDRSIWSQVWVLFIAIGVLVTGTLLALQ
jgi:membrane associated rhomboid family serine protease